MVIQEYVCETSSEVSAEWESALLGAPHRHDGVKTELSALLKNTPHQRLTFTSGGASGHRQYDLYADVEKSPVFVLRLQTGGLHTLYIDGRGLDFDPKNDRKLFILTSQCATLTRTHYLSKSFTCNGPSYFVSNMLRRLFPGHVSDDGQAEPASWTVRYDNIHGFGMIYTFDFHIDATGQFSISVIPAAKQEGIRIGGGPPPTQKIAARFRDVTACRFDWVESYRPAPSIQVTTGPTTQVVSMESGILGDYPGCDGSAFHLPVYLSFATMYMMNALRLYASATCCPKCGSEITFSEGLRLSHEAGISDNVLMCRSCECMFAANMTSTGLSIHSEVTDKHAAHLGKTKCTVCAGAGKIECQQCGGKGYMQECDLCSGKKTTPCTCGNGQSVCSRCDGRGITALLFGLIKAKCSKCSGNGKVDHLSCKGSGLLDCSRCGGTGMTGQCPQCLTEGFLKCNTCGGGGWVTA